MPYTDLPGFEWTNRSDKEREEKYYCTDEKTKNNHDTENTATY